MNVVKKFGLITIFALSGCAHSTMRGTVAMKISDREAHVCLGDKEVQVGDPVTLFKNVCVAPKSSAGGGEASCTKQKLGQVRNFLIGSQAISQIGSHSISLFGATLFPER
jgi:hypothetical protein